MLELLIKTFKKGITPENFPLAATMVYTEVSKVSNKNTTDKEISNRCEYLLVYIIDNTSAGEYDKTIDAVLKQMVPGIISSIMSPQETLGFFKKLFCCARRQTIQDDAPLTEEDVRQHEALEPLEEPHDSPTPKKSHKKKRKSTRVEQIKMDAI